MKKQIMEIMDVNEKEYRKVLEWAAYAGAVFLGLAIGHLINMF